VKTTGVNGGKDERQLVINTTCRTKNTTKSTTPLIISVGTSRSKPFLENLEDFGESMRRLDSAGFGLGSVMGWDEATVKASLQVHHAKDRPDLLRI
jgi:hypothetical protein